MSDNDRFEKEFLIAVAWMVVRGMPLSKVVRLLGYDVAARVCDMQAHSFEDMRSWLGKARMRIRRVR